MNLSIGIKISRKALQPTIKQKSLQMKLPVYNCVIDENTNDDTGIYAISFVDCPANETDFITLSKQEVFMNKDEKKQILTGVVLKPEQLIYRENAALGEHYIKFSAGQIEKIAQKMMKTGIALHNTTHQHQMPLNGNYMTELWIIENPENDKSNALGFHNLPKGTLMCSYKIEDETYWNNEVMTGNVKGFSLEGLFSQEISMSKLSNIKKPSMKKKRFIFSTLQKAVMLASGVSKQTLSDIESIEADDVTGSGKTFREFILVDGKTVLIDADGFATMDGEQMPAGEHKLADGNILIVDENGDFLGTQEPSAKSENSEEKTPAQALAKLHKKLSQTEAKPEEKESKNTEVNELLKEKIAEMQAIIDELVKQTESTEKEVAELKRKTPSTRPAIGGYGKAKPSEMSHTDLMALSAQMGIKSRKK